MANRLGGKKVKLPDTGKKLDRIFTYQLESMNAAVWRFKGAWANRNASPQVVQEMLSTVPPAMMAGNPSQMPAILSQADELAEGAVSLDPRLGGRPGWVHAAEGIDLDPAAFLAGEENCCLARRKQKIKDQQAAGEPVRIVISTDTAEITPAAAAAFIAAARLAAQFVPLEIWWQGSWLKESGEWQGNGHVFHVPLVAAGEMDFSRLHFVLCSPLRDQASFMIMRSYAFPAGLGWGAGLLSYSLLPETKDFIPASGIHARAGEVAERAARWAGMDPAWVEKWEAGRSSEQTWAPAPDASSEGETWKEPTPEERRQWAKDSKEREARERAEERERARNRKEGIL